MKISTKKLFISCLAATFLMVGCEGFLDINDDPNNPTEAPAQGLMTNVTYQTAQNMYQLGSITSYYVQYLASPNRSSSNDIHEASSFGTLWAQLYETLTDLSDLEVLAEEEGATEYLGVAKILKALNLATLVDAFGDVPYSDAFFAETLQPTYDDHAQLYDEIFLLLNDGLTELGRDETTLSIDNDDFIYEGDIEKWEKLAYMLRARYLNHFSKQSSYDPDAVLSALDDGFDSNDDDAQVTFFEEQINPWAQVARSNAGLILGGWLSEQIVDQLNGSTFGVEDPRIEFMTDTTDDGIYVGVENGAGRGTAPAAGAFSVLTEDTFYADATAPLLIATYAEQKFIEAEAAFEIDLARSYQAYLDGIEAHMNKLGVDEAERDAYMADPEVDPGEAGLTIDHIMKEKYVAMFLHPEAWVDARRYDYQYEDMDLPANHNSDLGGEFIRKLRYPDSELQRNASNVPDSDEPLLEHLVWDEE